MNIKKLINRALNKLKLLASSKSIIKIFLIKNIPKQFKEFVIKYFHDWIYNIPYIYTNN